MKKDISEEDYIAETIYVDFKNSLDVKMKLGHLPKEIQDQIISQYSKLIFQPEIDTYSMIEGGQKLEWQVVK